jgi:tRNA pseudouridine38-40 synthase
MRNVRLRLAYDGSKFFGWQRQDGFQSVQQALEESVLALTGQVVTVHGAGRTDTGVHALGQVAHFHVETRLDDDRLCHALNAHVSDGIVIERAETCGHDFHARFDAVSKRYMYVTLTSRFRPPFAHAHSHWIRYPLDLGAMRRAAARLVGRQDFRAFGNTGSPRPSTVRTIHDLRFIVRSRALVFVVQADGFLYNMVRTIAGTLLDVGRGAADRALSGFRAVSRARVRRVIRAPSTELVHRPLTNPRKRFKVETAMPLLVLTRAALVADGDDAVFSSDTLSTRIEARSRAHPGSTRSMHGRGTGDAQAMRTMHSRCAGEVHDAQAMRTARTRCAARSAGRRASIGSTSARARCGTTCFFNGRRSSRPWRFECKRRFPSFTTTIRLACAIKSTKS